MAQVNGAWAAALLAVAGHVGAQTVDAALTPDAHALVTGVLTTGDHHGAPFIVIDKRQARLWVLDAQGRVQGATPVLLGLARGDGTVPGIGDRPLAQVRPEERTTPAGRFGLEAGVNTGGEDIFWVDYDAGVSLHRVRATNPAERRLQRLATPTVADNRISYGCINVPAAFFDRFIQPRFQHLPPAQAAVYVLPEVQTLQATFDFLRPAPARP